MKITVVRSHVVALAAACAIFLSACGSSGDSSPPPVQPTVAAALAAAAALPANDTATNSSSAFKVLQDAGVPAVTVASPPKVNFTVFSDGAVKQGLALSNVSFAIAKLVPGTNGDIDQWVNYVYRTETAAAGVGPNGTPALATAKQATTDPKPAGQAATQLVYSTDGYYTYTFSTDITDPTKTNGVVYEPDRTHRIAIQLAYTNAAGETVRVNPYFDVTFDAAGKAVPVTDPTKTRVMTDVTACNGCHSKLSLHGGGRVDTQFCVMCHNPGTTDANSGNVLTMQTMVHKIHAGKLLASKPGGEDYTIWGFGNSKHDYAEIGFPQDLRNCTKCHTAANPKTPQGDNWKTRASKESCLTCHANNAGSSWDTSHAVFAGTLVGAGATAKQLTNAQCADCHVAGSAIAPERVHWNQNEENSALYKMNIDSAAYDANARTVTIQYYLSNPAAGNAAYNLVTPDCTGAGATLACSSSTRFGNLRFYFAYQNLVGQSTAVTEFSAYNNGGSGANVYAYKGTNDGNNRYTATIQLPPDTASAVVAGTGRVIGIGQIKEPLLQVKWATDPRPEVAPVTLINTVVQHTYKDVYLSGPAFSPRRQVVSNEKCNTCHGALGTTSGSNTLANAFHSGGRDTVEACAVCHDANRSSSTVMTNGLALQEAYHFKRMIHGIHGNLRRIYPFTHGNAVVGAFCNPRNALSVSPLCDPNLTLATTGVENYAAEVGWPGTNPSVSIDCNACHVNDSYKLDRSPLGSVISTRPAGSDPLTYSVISPKAATCTACHDSPTAIAHVTSFGNAAFGSRTQAQSLLVQETCNDCHSSGGFKGVDIVHGLK